MIRRASDMFDAAAAARRRPIREQVVLYESFNGNGMLCHPEAIFRYVKAEPTRRHLSHVWALADTPQNTALREHWAGDSTVSFVTHGSTEYYRALGTARLLVNNTTFPPPFAKRPEQTYLNTWHGTPLKTMGYHMPQGGEESTNVVRNFLSADYLLSSGSWMTETMYADAYRLRGVFTGQVLEAGSPRVDLTLGGLPVAPELAKMLPTRTPGVTNVLLAPTWQGESFAKPLSDARRLRRMAVGLAERLGDGYRVLAKAHQRVYASASGEVGLQASLVPNELPSNVLLSAIDVLVTDFSSIAYDFLPTGRPVIYYSSDPEAYRRNRGYYIEPDQWPGPLVRTLDDLATIVQASGSGRDDDPLVTHRRQYDETRARVASLDDGHATERLVEAVFDGHDSVPARRLPSDKPSVLIYLGDMRPNGISSAGVNLASQLEHDAVDVTVTYSGPRDPARRQVASLLDERVRRLPRLGGGHPGPTRGQRRLRRDRLQELGWGPLDDTGHNAALVDEWRRCFGQASFDRVVDFSGYGSFFARLMLAGSAPGQRSIWLHNDMVSDSERTTEGVAHLRTRLQEVFAHYTYYDHLVSVSDRLSEINSTRLADFAGPDAFTYASNTIDARRILRMASGSVTDTPQTATESRAPVDIHSVSLRDGVQQLMSRFPPQAVLEEARLWARTSAILPSSPSGNVFVTVGRLSPEKNQSRLLQAFALVHEAHPDARLLLLGDGPLMEPLKAEARELGLDLRRDVGFTGHVTNPFAILQRCDCFVLSSDYEGQPMVILEARVLGLPVVSTGFDSVRGALDKTTGMITERTADSLAAGMLAFLDGKVPAVPFDADAYNRRAVREFITAIGLHAPQALADAAVESTTRGTSTPDGTG